ncbi:hypothetical protein ACKWTF_014571 [Chironomus riparius]
MAFLKKFLFCISMENGCYIIATYITLVNSCYIAILMMILNSFNVLSDHMSGSEKFQMLMVASCVNFLVYYLFGSLLLVLGVNERNYLTLNYFNMVHGAMTVFNFLCGLLFSYIFESLELLIIMIADALIRTYFFFIVLALSTIFRTEELENNLLNANSSQEESHRMSMYSENDLRYKRDSLGFDLYMNGID